MSLLTQSAHIPTLIILQIIFIILFGVFAIYNPENALVGSPDGKGLYVYPMFQDVHVMIFIGFGFLMTFLKKYGLSAVSLNMLISVIAIQWATLVYGFFHLHKHHDRKVIYLDLSGMLSSDFAAATILISFGAVIGKTSPFQLIIMTLIEIVLFIVNEVIGRNLIGAVDAGDTIFVHLFGAYFGLFCSLAMSHKRNSNNDNQGSRYNSDLFSMIGTIFLWMFWPSFNAAAAVKGGPQHRAILNTYYSLCACTVVTFAISALTNPKRKFVMEHIQNATLAGGVAIGASSDMIVTPFGSLIVGSFAGLLSTVGFDYITPFINNKFRIHDTCGVHNLHGMPALFGAIVSMIVAACSTENAYTKTGLEEVFPLMMNGEVTPSGQGTKQLIATVITLAIAAVGGLVTGIILRLIGKCQKLDESFNKSNTMIRLSFTATENPAVSQPSATVKHIHNDALFNDNMFFSVTEEDTCTVVANGEKNSQFAMK